MASSKSNSYYAKPLPPAPPFTQSVPVLPTVNETEEELPWEQDLVASRKMLLTTKRPSRLERLSSYLLPLKTTDSKIQKDQPQHRVHRKRLPSPYTEAHQQHPFQAPTRPPPVAPGNENLPPAQAPPNPTNRLQKPASPSRQPQTQPSASAPRSHSPSYTHGDVTRPGERTRPRGNSLAPPPALKDNSQGSPTTSPLSSRPTSYHSEGETDNATSKLRKSWMPGGSGGGRSRSRNTSQDLSQTSIAWVNAGAAKIDYSTAYLLNGEKVPELWEENGDAYIYLFPPSSGRGPSFKIPSIVLSASQPLLNIIHGDIYAGRSKRKSFDGRGNLLAEDAMRNLAIRDAGTPPYTPKTSTSDDQTVSSGSAESIRSLADPPREIHLHFPVGLTWKGSQPSQQDFQALVDVRNLFAFLTGQPLVATRSSPTTYHIFLSIAATLRKFEFTNFSGSTYGESATASFGFYLQELRLADVRHSREKTIEGIILGERMRCEELYNEAFAHAVGKYAAIKDIPLFTQISSNTQVRLQRASQDLANREASAAVKLTDFEFPSLFAGIAASTTSPESKIIRFKTWKSHFASMRKMVYSYYKDLHGQWPPKGSSKKNQFVEGGLNRLVLKILYTDLCNLYDLLADRQSLTTRTYAASDEGEDDAGQVCPNAAALRKLLNEFDNSSPPVCPPIPFDVPNLPTIATVEPNFPMLAPTEQHQQSTRRLKDYENMLVVAKSHNLDTDRKTPFLDAFKAFEYAQARGCNAQELVEMRIGHWIFLYACLQSLPMLVIDAPGVTFTDGVEYFLCVPPLGSPPWVEDGPAVKMAWYGVQGGQGVVSLPSDIVNYGVEATYIRSHCWVMAQKWINMHHDSDVATIPDTDIHGAMSPLSPPPGFDGTDGGLAMRPSVRARQRASSAHGTRSASSNRLSAVDARSRSRQNQRNSIALGLERLPIPTGHEEWSPSPMSAGGSHSRNGSRGNSPMDYTSGQRQVSSRSGETPTSGKPASGTEPKGTTFDDILSSMDQPESGKGKKGKMW